MAAPAPTACVVIPVTCDKCKQELDVDCVRNAGFGMLNFYAIDCPACDRLTYHQLPGDILDVRKRGEVVDE